MMHFYLGGYVCAQSTRRDGHPDVVHMHSVCVAPKLIKYNAVAAKTWTAVSVGASILVSRHIARIYKRTEREGEGGQRGRDSVPSSFGVRVK